MENLQIIKTKSTLAINFDAKKGILEMSGSSYPENAISFFQPINDWINAYISKVKKPILMKLKLYYLNTTSTKCLFDILEILEKYYIKGGNVEVKWYYEENDDEIFEMGKGIIEDTELPLELISY